MKTIVISVVLILMCHLNGISQEVYFILTSKTTPKGVNLQEGIKRSTSGDGDVLYKTAVIQFNLISRSKQIRETFMHTNYNLSELAKTRPVKTDDQMEILTKPVSFLQTITPIDLDIKFPTMTKVQAVSFGQSMIGKKIYIIDRNDTKNGIITLIQVKYLKLLSF